MRKIIITYGLISGTIVAALMFATMSLYKTNILSHSNGEVIGYTTMVIALSLVFFGVRSCRDNYFNGVLTFGQGLKIGLLISLISALMYALAWEVCYNTFMSGFAEEMANNYLDEIKASGKSAADINAAVAQMESFKVWYKNPVLRFGMTLLEILPVGIVISLISAALLRKKGSVQSIA